MNKFPFDKYLNEGFELHGDDGIITYPTMGGYLKTHIRNVVTSYTGVLFLVGDKDLFSDVIGFYMANRGSPFLFTDPATNEDLEARFTARPLIDKWFTSDTCSIKIQIAANNIPNYGDS